jgi:Ras-related protein Rab-2A
MAASFDKSGIVRFILLGCAGVGKTSILHRFCDGRFTHQSQSTIGVDFKWRDIELDGETFRLQVWDTAGQEQFKVIARSYYRQADGVLLVYDTTNEETLDGLESFIEDARELCNLGVVFILLGNKSDLIGDASGGTRSSSTFMNQNVSREVGEQFARRHGIPLFFETSAKTGDHIDDAFEVLCRHVLNNRVANGELSSISAHSRSASKKKLDLSAKRQDAKPNDRGIGRPLRCCDK